MADSSNTADAIHYELEQSESWKTVAHCKVETSFIDEMRGEAAERIRKKARLKGFRPGKAPLKLIHSSFASEIEQEAIEGLIPKVWDRVLKEREDLHPISDPSVENFTMDEGQPVAFDLVVEVRPDLEIKGIDGLELERKKTPIDDETVDKALGDLAERNATWVPIEDRGAAEGDALLIDYVPLDAEGDPREEERNPGYAMELGTQNVLPEFNSALIGLQLDEDTNFDVTYPDDFPKTELAGQTMNFHVKLLELKEKRLPALDDDFAESNTPFSTLDELKVDVRADLAKQAERHDETELRESAVDKLLDQNAVPVPESLLGRYLDAMMSDMARGQEMPEEQKKALSEAYMPQARRSVQRMVLLDNLRRQNKIDVDDEAIKIRVQEMAEERSVKPEQMRAALEQNRGIERLRNELEEEMVFASLLEGAKIAEVARELPAATEEA